MPLRGFARKLGAPANAALQRASSPRVSPAAGSGLRASRSSQRGEGSREAHRMTYAEALETLKLMEKWNKESERNYQEVLRLIDNLPRTLALSAAAAIFTGTSIVAYAAGALE